MTEDQPAIRPTKERARHDQITTPEKDRDHQHERPARVETQTQIDRYERRKSIDPDQAEAARRYFADAYYGGAVPRLGVVGIERVDKSPEALSERYVAAVQRRKHAVRALGVGLVSIVEWVAVDDHSAEAWSIKRGEHPRFGITLLRLALGVLVKHYGIGQSKAA